MTNIDLHQNEHTNPHIFEFGDHHHQIRVAKIDEHGVPWFVARDVGAALYLTNIRASTALLADDDKGVSTVYSLGGPQEMTIISESGLYELVFRSRRKEAREFTRWVTREVLPSIRQTGIYARPGALPSGDPAIRELLETQREILAVERERLDLERAKHTLSRFPEVEDLERGAVRSKLTQMIDLVATVRGRCPALIWRELYLVVKTVNGIDLYAQTAAARGTGDKVKSILQLIENLDLTDLVYRTARNHFREEIVARPAVKRVPQLHVTGPLPTDELAALEDMHDWIRENSALN